ncbi:unnamed protein product [Effrenium voratum]|uniref:PDZ domain-containing protein n=1 Tax=Effrenium voratum TaxID=2562239 RepID=A0AA36MNY3_9DINO|nr:unnamed protein product [Effrenium voratum]
MVARSGSSARASSLGNVGREYVPKQPRLSLFIPCERGLLNPPRTSEAMDNILQVMEVAWRQVNAARGSTVKLANPEHNLLVSFESARDFMLGMLSEPDPGRKHLDEVFGGDFSRIARVRAILDAAKLSTRNMGDDRVSSCMNAVKSVEGVLKKDFGASSRLKEAQSKELKRMQQKQSRFEAKHLRGEFSPLSKSPGRNSMFNFGVSAGGRPRPRSASDVGPGESDALQETWKALRESWETGSLFRSWSLDLSGDGGHAPALDEDSQDEALEAKDSQDEALEDVPILGFPTMESTCEALPEGEEGSAAKPINEASGTVEPILVEAVQVAAEELLKEQVETQDMATEPGKTVETSPATPAVTKEPSLAADAEDTRDALVSGQCESGSAADAEAERQAEGQEHPWQRDLRSERPVADSNNHEPVDADALAPMAQLASPEALLVSGAMDVASRVEADAALEVTAVDCASIEASGTVEPILVEAVQVAAEELLKEQVETQDSAIEPVTSVETLPATQAVTKEPSLAADDEDTRDALVSGQCESVSAADAEAERQAEGQEHPWQGELRSERPIADSSNNHEPVDADALAPLAQLASPEALLVSGAMDVASRVEADAALEVNAVDCASIEASGTVEPILVEAVQVAAEELLKEQVETQDSAIEPVTSVETLPATQAVTKEPSLAADDEDTRDALVSGQCESVSAADAEAERQAEGQEHPWQGELRSERPVADSSNNHEPVDADVLAPLAQLASPEALLVSGAMDVASRVEADAALEVNAVDCASIEASGTVEPILVEAVQVAAEELLKEQVETQDSAIEPVTSVETFPATQAVTKEPSLAADDEDTRDALVSGQCESVSADAEAERQAEGQEHPWQGELRSERPVADSSNNHEPVDADALAPMAQLASPEALLVSGAMDVASRVETDAALEVYAVDCASVEASGTVEPILVETVPGPAEELLKEQVETQDSAIEPVTSVETLPATQAVTKEPSLAADDEDTRDALVSGQCESVSAADAEAERQAEGQEHPWQGELRSERPVADISNNHGPVDADALAPMAQLASPEALLVSGAMDVASRVEADAALEVYAVDCASVEASGTVEPILVETVPGPAEELLKEQVETQDSAIEPVTSVETATSPAQTKGIESDSDSDDVPMPENWGMVRQKRGSVIRPVPLPEHLLEPARLAGYGHGTDVVEFQVGQQEEKIGIAFKILPPAGHLVVEKITPGTPAEALRLPKGSRLLCVNGQHTGSIEAEDFFQLMQQRPLQLLFLRPELGH